MEHIPAMHAAKVGMRYPARAAGPARRYGRNVIFDLIALAPGRSPTLYATLIWEMTLFSERAKAFTAGQSLEVVLIHVYQDETGDLLVSLPADPAWLAWHGGTVRQLSQRIRDTDDMTLLPILAGALEDAGCAEAELLARCREPQNDDLGWLATLLATQE